MNKIWKRLRYYLLAFFILEILMLGYQYQDLRARQRLFASKGIELNQEYTAIFYGKVFMTTLMLLLCTGFVYHVNRSRRLLAQSKNRLQEITDSIGDGLFVLNESKTITFANPAAEKLLRYARGELTGQTVHSVFPHHTAGCPICQAVERGTVWHSDTLAFQTKQATQIPVELTISPLFEKGQQVIGAVVAFHDIIQRKQTQEALQEERNLLRTLIDTIPDPVYLKDVAGRYLMVNRAFVKLFRQPDEQAILSKTIADLLPQIEAALITELDRQVVDTGQPLLGQEVLFSTLGDQGMWVSKSTAPLRHESGEIFGTLGLNRDITPLKRAEAQFIQANNALQDKNRQLAELNASKDKFFSIISHDLRSPFTTLLGFTQLLAERFDQYPLDKIKNRIDQIRTSAESLYALLENLLTWSRVQRGLMQCDPETLELKDMVADALSIFQPKAEHKGIALQSDIQQDIFVYADFSMVNTILRNLISNALKFTKSGGSVTVSAAPRDQMIEIAVADTGEGIDAAGLASLFRLDTPSQIGTAGERGTGLGLNLCKELVEKNGGKIRAQSVVDQGTTFAFTLPKAPTE